MLSIQLGALSFFLSFATTLLLSPKLECAIWFLSGKITVVLGVEVVGSQGGPRSVRPHHQLAAGTF